MARNRTHAEPQRSARDAHDRPVPAARIAGGAGLLFLGIVLVATTMRSPITGVGPLVGTIRHATGLSATGAGVLTALPVFAFALASPAAPGIAGRIGIERTVLSALLVSGSGVLLRSIPGTVPLFAGTLLLGAAIAMANVLLPGLIKQDFPHRVGAATSAYVAVMNIMAAVSSGVVVPISDAAPGGWRTALACWAVLIVLAVAVWLPATRHRRAGAAHVPAPAAARPWRSPLAWSITAFMGLQSMSFYTVISWLPTILHDRGMSTGAAGWELFGYQIIALAANFATPLLIHRGPDQRLLAVGWSVIAVVGFTGLVTVPGLSLLWVLMAGLASGGSLVLALSFFSLRTTDARQAAAMSGMAQTFGYLLAGTGPIVFGGLHEISGTWTVPLALLGVLAAAQLAMGVRAGRATTI